MKRTTSEALEQMSFWGVLVLIAVVFSYYWYGLWFLAVFFFLCGCVEFVQFVKSFFEPDYPRHPHDGLSIDKYASYHDPHPGGFRRFR